MKKQKFLSEKKLVKTTTITMVLLIAATLISSSAVSVTFGNNTSTINKEAGNMPAVSVNNLMADSVSNPGSPSAGDDPGDVLWYFDVSTTAPDTQCLGVEMTDESTVWVTGGNSGADPNKLYTFDDTGTLLATYDQPSHSTGWGWRDMAYDGTYLYASVGYNVDEIDPATGAWTGNTIPGPINPCRALAYDPATDHFWTASFTSDFYEFDRSGTVISQYTNPWGGAYGMAWDDISPGGPYLWVHDQYGSGTDIHQIDPSTGAHTGVTWTYTQGVAGGADVIAKDGFVQFVGLTQGTPDEVFGIELASAGPPPEHDVGIKSINEPSSGTAAGSFTPEVTVKNYGNASETTDVQLTIDTGLAPVILLSVDFSTGIPGDWTIIDGGTSTDTWFYDPGVGAVCDSDAAGSGATMYEELISPVIDCSALTSVILEYDHYFYGGSSSWINQGEVFVWDGSTWVSVAFYPAGTSASGLESIDITAQAAGNSNVQVKFVFDDLGTWGYYWEVYDFLVRSPGTFVTEYDETVTGVTVAVGATVDVTFPAWEPLDWQVSENVDINYDIYATTLLADNNSANDAKDKALVLSYPYLHDVRVASINDPPSSGPGKTYPVEVTVENVGQFPECCYLTNVQIAEKVYTINGFYSNFEANNGGFTSAGDGLWAWGEPTSGPSSAYSGSKLWGTNLAGNYINNADSRLESGVITVPTGGDLSYQHWYYCENTPAYNYDGYNVKISTDYGSSWSVLGAYLNPYTHTYCYAPSLSGQDSFSGNHQYWEEVTFDLSAYEGMDIMLRFHFGSDSSVCGYPGVYIDDVLVGDVTVTLDVEYNEDICTVALDPGQSADITFPDWTPENLALGISGGIDYDVTAITLDYADTNPANDQLSSDTSLDYWHDVLVKDVVPSIGGRGDEWLQYDTGVYSNAFGSTGLTIYGANRFTPTELAPYDGWYLTTIKWKNYAPSSMTGEVIVYDGGTPTAPGPILVADPVSVSGDVWYEFVLSTPVQIDASKDIWLCIKMTHISGEHPIECSTPGFVGKSFWFSGDGTSWTDVVALGYDVSAMIRGLVTEGGAPGAETYVPLGSQAISAVVENAGVFSETGLTANAKIYEYITNETVGTLVWEANVTGINLDPLGGQQTCNFGSYNFAIEGIYKIVIKCELTDDANPDNNEEDVGIGADGTAPTSDYTVVPGTPDGDNDWYVSDVTVSFTADDGTEAWQSGVDHIEYKVNGGSVQTGDSVTLTADGDHDVEYRAVDNVGNEESWNSVTTTIHMDQTAPTVDLTWEASGSGTDWQITFTATCSDATSGMNRVEFFIEGAHQFTDDAEPYEWIINWSSALEGVIFYAYAYDDAGNENVDEVDGGNIEAVSLQLQATPVVRQRQTNSL